MIHLLIPGIILISVFAGALVFYRMHRRAVYSRIIFSIMAAGGTLFGILLLIAGLFLAALHEPWPLSLRQGPDTDYARSCFERYLGEVHPPAITDIHCRELWGFGGDSIRSVRFSFGRHSQLERLVRLHALHRVEESDRSAFRYRGGPSWWLSEADLLALPEAYRHTDTEYLWVNPDARVEYYQVAGY